MAYEEEEEGKKKKGGKRVNIGARTGMIAPVVSLTATAIVAMYTYAQNYPIIWWFIIVFATMAFFLLIGSLLQTVVEIIVEKTIKREKEEKRLKELEDSEGILQDEAGAQPAQGTQN